VFGKISSVWIARELRGEFKPPTFLTPTHCHITYWMISYILHVFSYEWHHRLRRSKKIFYDSNTKAKYSLDWTIPKQALVNSDHSFSLKNIAHIFSRRCFSMPWTSFALFLCDIKRFGNRWISRTFNSVLEVVRIQILAKIYRAKCSDSWFIVLSNFLLYLAMVKI